MLQQIESHIALRVIILHRDNFSNEELFEFLQKIRLMVYEVVLLFFYLSSTQMAIERIALKVSKGGHNITLDVIERRYKSGIKNLIELIKIVDRWSVYDNSKSPAKIKQGF
jgi:predicted ABC-type ATPase